MFVKYARNGFPSDKRPSQMWDGPNYVIDLQKRLVSVKFKKKLTAITIEKYASSIRQNPRFDPAFSELVDMTEVEELDLKPEEFIRLADKIDPFSSDSMRAFVVRDEVQNHAARMHKILRPGRNFGIFRSVEDAKKWLRV